jgi:serine/threonine protein phosphatase PrpC
MDWNTLLQETGIGDASRRAAFIQKYENKMKESLQALWNEFEASDDREDGATQNAQQEAEIAEIRFDEEAETAEPAETPAALTGNNLNEALEAQIKGKHLFFPNGKVNHPYAVPFDPGTHFPDLSEVEFTGLENIGLHYDPAAKQIAGTPVLAGDHKIGMNCKRKDWTEGKPLIHRHVTIIINPDPKSLWKNIPTPREIEYFKNDEDKDFVKVTAKQTKGFLGLGKKQTARKDMVAASQRGRSHALEGKPRDDDFKLHFDSPSEWYIMAVADGAGSAKYSRKGSQIASQTVIDVFLNKLSEQRDRLEKSIAAFAADKSPENRKAAGDILYNIIGNAVFKAFQNIEEEAKTKNAATRDYATTLLVAACKKFDFGWFTGAFWVGDGGIGVYRHEPPLLKILGEPDGGEFAGQTRFLTMPEIMQPAEIYRRLRFDVFDDFTALILMTDGVTDPKFETDANLTRIEKWRRLWDDLNGKNEDNAKVDFSDDSEHADSQLLQWLDFWSRGNHDDRTIAILF